MLSGIKDVDREILKHVDDEELLKICSIDKKTWIEVCDDNFLKRRLMKYPGIEKYKLENESYKQFFLRFAYYISKMKEKYEFRYTEGDFDRQYKMLQTYPVLLIKASKSGILPLVKHAVEKGEHVSSRGNLALRLASSYGHLQVVKYLLDHGADIHSVHDEALRNASFFGYFDVVKYLVERGADIHAYDDQALNNAKINNHVEVANYLESVSLQHV